MQPRSAPDLAHIGCYEGESVLRATLAVDGDDDASAFSAGGHQVVVRGGQEHVVAVLEPG
jgi:hypothetical protein